MAKKFKRVVRVACQGGNRMLIHPRKLDGIKSCIEADKVEDGACKYGCLGLGDCVEACKFDAMWINDQGIVEIDEGKCTGCGVCVKKCPRDVLFLIKDREKSIMVQCNAQGKGKDKIKLCRSACIGCTICQQVCPFDAIKVVDGLAKIDYAKCRSCGMCVDVCPACLDYDKVIVDLGNQDEKKIAVIDASKCNGCTVCKKVCPMANAITGKRKEAHVVHPEFCVGCGACIEKCKKEAITMEYRKQGIAGLSVVTAE